MADDYCSWTLPCPETEIPIDLATKDGHELPDSISTAMGKPGVLLTISREDWLNGALVNAYSALGGTALAFLVKDPQSLPGDLLIRSRPVGGGAVPPPRKVAYYRATAHRDSPGPGRGRILANHGGVQSRKIC